ncbi:MAG: histidine--tRNA ligase [Myxococcales bacterium]|nr:histidine--tRNA ligase [Myxococcales bacterium]
MQAQTLKGFRDFLPTDMAPRQAMVRRIEVVFETHGFSPLQTPALEYLETLTGKYGDEGDKLLYRFTDHGDRQVALRYDLTVPLARVVAQHRAQLQLPFRRYQIAPVWRADKPQRGRYREFVQCDADICGADSALADAEVLVAGLSVLRSLGVEQAQMHLNHRDILFGILRLCNVPHHPAQIACIRAIDKLDKLTPAAVVEEIVQQADLPADQAQAVVAAFAAGWPLSHWQQQALDAADLPMQAAIERVAAVINLVTAAGLDRWLAFDCSIARGLDYYTGIIYETRLTDPKVASMGAVMSGGRYDGLIGLFGKEKIPAVGISVGLDRLFAALYELGLVRTDSAQVPIYATVLQPELAGAVLILVQGLRDHGWRAEIDTLGGKVGKQFERAAKRGARLALVLGPDEQAAGTVVVKDLRQSTQQSVAQTQLAAVVAAILRPQ